MRLRHALLYTAAGWALLVLWASGGSVVLGVTWAGARAARRALCPQCTRRPRRVCKEHR